MLGYVQSFIHQKTKKMAMELKGDFRLTEKDVPHVRVIIGRKIYSICWFHKSKFWRVFQGPPIIDFYEDSKLIEWFDNKKHEQTMEERRERRIYR